MTPWAPVPLCILHDPRACALSIPARYLLHTLYLRAAHDRQTVPVGQLTPEGVASAILGPEHRGAGSELVASGLVRSEGGVWRLAVTVDGDGFGPRPDALDATPAAPRGASSQPVASGRSAAQLRRARYFFERRARTWRDVPAGVSWESWCATPEGAAWLAGCDAVTPCDASQVTPESVTVTGGVTPGCDAVTGAVTPCDASPSDSPSEKETQKTKVDREKAVTRKASHVSPPVTPVTRDAVTPKTVTPVTPATPSPAPKATHPHDLPAVAVEEALIAATGGRLRLSAAAAPMGQAIVERLRREGVTLDELPRIAAVIGADGGRLLWPWPPDLRVTIDHLAKPSLPDGGGWGCTALGEAVAAARDGGVEGLRRRAATSARPARGGDRLAHLRAPMATPADFARDAAAIEATKIQDPDARRAAFAAIGVAEHDAPF